ncbi:MAG: YcxB family protein [Defluviitaleaceae bacterium]|nr:YcxB family protein [Defluviitaleaceae bacterium]
MFNFNFTLSEADYYEFNKHHSLSNLSAQKFILIVRIILFITLGVGIISQFIAGYEGGRLSPALFLSIIGILLSIFFKPFVLLLIKWQIREIKKQGKLPFDTNVHLQFDEEIYIESSETAEIKRNYTSIEKIVQGHEAIYLYVGAIQATLIPFSAFDNEGHKNDFLAFINSKIS